MNKTIGEKISKQIFQELLLLQLGSTWSIDSYYLFLLIPIDLVSSSVNVITLIFLNKPNIPKIRFFKYTKLFVVNSLLICLYEFVYDLTQIQRYWYTAPTYIYRLYVCSIRSNLGILFTILANLMNTLIILERMSAFLPSLAKFKRIKSYKILIGMFVYGFLVSLPASLVTHPISDEDFDSISSSLNQTLITNFNICSTADFFKNNLVSIIFACYVVTFYIGTYIIEGIASIVSVIKFKAYMRRMREEKMRLEAVGGVYGADETQLKESTELSEIDRNLTKMSIISSFLTASIAIIATMANAVSVIDANIYVYFLFFQKVSVSVRYSLTFVLLYFYNKTFRDLVFKRTK